MSAYSGSYSGSLPIVPMFLIVGMILTAGLLILSMMGGAAVQVAPKPTPERVGGVDIDKAVAEARSLIPKLKQPGDIEYLRSTGGLLRVYRGMSGKIYIIEHNGAPGLLAAAEKIAAALGILVGSS